MRLGKKIFPGFLLCAGLLFILVVALLFCQPRPDKSKPTVAVVLGYNFFLEEHWTAREYVAWVATELRRYPNLGCVVLSGANTRPATSFVSEAELMRRYFAREGFAANVLVEDRALTTEQNLEFSAQMLKEKCPTASISQVLIFSDAFPRHFSVLWHANRYFADASSSRFGIWQGGARLEHRHNVRTIRKRQSDADFGLATIDPGVLYASAQPSGVYLERLIGTYHIRTVINLRSDALESERKACFELKLRCIHVKTLPSRPLAQKDLAYLQELLTDAEDQPILLHGDDAADPRTKFVTAWYKTVVARWNMAETRHP